MSHKRKWILIILNSVGIFSSFYSFTQTERLNNYISGSSLICDIGNVASCTTTYLSNFAYLFNIPVSLFALIFFWFIAYLFIAKHRDSESLNNTFQFVAILNAIGVFFCCFYIYILIAVLKTICISCVIIDLVVFANFVILFNPLKEACRNIFINFMPFFRATRNKTLSLLLLIVTGIALFQVYRIILNNKNDVYLEAFFLQKEITSNIKDYHSVTWGNKDAGVEVKIFEDYFCKYCKIASFRYRELFKKDNPDVKIVFINYPLGYHPGSNRFNIFISKVMTSASDDQNFWDFHDIILNKASDLDSASVFNIARNELNNFKNFQENFMITNFDSIFRVNISFAREYQINGTPAIFINNRKLEEWTNINLLNKIIHYQP
jgi:uncharacterized membrane protein